MRYLALYALSIFTAVITLGSCKKETASKATASRFVLASVSGSGEAFSSSDDMVRTNKNAASPFPYVEVNGTSASGARISVWIYSYVGSVGTYTMDGTNYGGTYKPSTASIPVLSAHGSLTVSAVTPNLTGSFNFTCSDSTVVTGTFNSTMP
ncbi:MAG: hypothetical protein K9G49_10410 [Taibaiella sp.]|nr:hypothetical protein [Taibaiella sp.]